MFPKTAGTTQLWTLRFLQEFSNFQHIPHIILINKPRNACAMEDTKETV